MAKRAFLSGDCFPVHATYTSTKSWRSGAVASEARSRRLLISEGLAIVKRRQLTGV
ncbi:hypothetical protein [Methylobacterium soli]|uniref:hypothetical protein n=1 Tax=Methylobacterium soli TaxID=553447 RepID=UPI001783D338|nr:hypothetical protein [Methylobacterium soli]